MSPPTSRFGEQRLATRPPASRELAGASCEISHSVTNLTNAGLCRLGAADAQAPSPEPAVERLSRYRRVLECAAAQGVGRLYSHELAQLAGVSAAQVRRDLMEVSVVGSPRHGYAVDELVTAIKWLLLGGDCSQAVLVGLGRLGRAMLAYFASRQAAIRIVAGFDVDPSRVDRVIEGCHAYPMQQLEEQVRKCDVKVAVLTTPALVAQAVCDRLVAAGVSGIANFAPVTLDVPQGVYVQNVDLTMWFEKVTYFAHHPRADRASRRRHP